MSDRQLVRLYELTELPFSAYGSVLGKPFPAFGGAPAFKSATSDFWHEGLFKSGGDETEILWVNYRDTDPRVDRLEMHKLTDQAVIPLTGDIVQVVASSSADGGIDPDTIRAFRVPVGKGLCMRPGCWHATRIMKSEVTCAMITRRSTTADLINHLTLDRALAESAFSDVRIQLSL